MNETKSNSNVSKYSQKEKLRNIKLKKLERSTRLAFLSTNYRADSHFSKLLRLFKDDINTEFISHSSPKGNQGLWLSILWSQHFGQFINFLETWQFYYFGGNRVGLYPVVLTVNGRPYVMLGIKTKCKAVLSLQPRYAICIHTYNYKYFKIYKHIHPNIHVIHEYAYGYIRFIFITTTSCISRKYLNYVFTILIFV